MAAAELPQRERATHIREMLAQVRLELRGIELLLGADVDDFGIVAHYLSASKCAISLTVTSSRRSSRARTIEIDVLPAGKKKSLVSPSRDAI